MRVGARAASTLVAAILVASPLAAQVQTSFSIALGAAAPVGSTADSAGLGYNATVAVGFKPRLAPIGLRIEGALNSLDAKNNVPEMRILAAIANVTLSRTGVPIPLAYGIAGLGVYNSSRDFPPPIGERSSTDVGFNLGGGLNFPLTGFTTFLEARFHFVTGTRVKFIPITFGLKF